jgi:hypothetical protein
MEAVIVKLLMAEGGDPEGDILIWDNPEFPLVINYEKVKLSNYKLKSISF